jgi:hypothetical protein
MTDLHAIFTAIQPLLRRYQPPLAPKNDTERYFDLWSFKDLEIEGRRRTEVFFAGLIIQKTYVGFYFMPVYAEPEIKVLFPPELLRLLKGKSCFHIRTLTPALLSQIEAVLEQGFDLYRQRGWA